MAEAANDYVYVTLKIVGGEIPGAVLAQKIGPLGLPVKTIADDIKKKTEEFKSLKVTVLLKIKDRKAQVEVTPGTSVLILKALREPPRDRKKVKNVVHNGNLLLSDIIYIARKKFSDIGTKKFQEAVKSVLGTCVSIGCTVDGKTPKEVIAEINNGEIALQDN